MREGFFAVLPVVMGVGQGILLFLVANEDVVLGKRDGRCLHFAGLSHAAAAERQEEDERCYAHVRMHR
jgi:hypothetical protein